jgi:hypothetical protein
LEGSIQGNKRVCYACGSSETLIDKRYGTANWMNNIDQSGNITHVICSRCYDIFRNKKKRKIQKSMNYYNHQEDKQHKQVSYYYRNKDKIRERRKEYYKRPEVKISHAVGQARRRFEARSKLYKMLGGRCVKCNNNDFRVLQLDHKQSQGLAEVKKLFEGSFMKMYRYYIERPDEAKKYVQLLCANCNLVKKYENGEIRHYFDVF